MKYKVPLAIPDLSGNELAYVTEAIQSSWISSIGPYVTRFENDFAALCGANTAVAVSNGTVALHLAMVTLGLEPGDEVIVPSLTFVATASTVRHAGAEPVFIDVEPETWCMDPDKIEEKITSRTRGIIAVHLYGHPADMDRINAVAKRHNLWVIEDAAEAPMASYRGRAPGSLAPIGSFSFYGNKVLTAGEGGALTFADVELAQRARMLRDHGMDPQRRYYFPMVGYNYRLTNIACAILCAQLERHEQILSGRQRIFSRYCGLLADIPGIGLQPVAEWAKLSPWLFSITVDETKFGMNRDKLMQYLAQNGVDSRPFFYPVHRLPPYLPKDNVPAQELPVTELLAARGMNLPTFSAMTDEQIAYASSCIRQACAHK